MADPQARPAAAWRVASVLKRDALGRVERLEGPGGVLVRRVACGSRVPGTRLAARLLLARERRAQERLAGLAGVAAIVRDAEAEAARGEGGAAPAPREVLLREWIEGRPLFAAERLPRDYFELLAELVREIHARGVCHNDLHKENNVLVGADGRPFVVDFQLASVHAGDSRAARVRRREDLRHVDKHRRRYEERGAKSSGPRPRRSALAWAWRRLGKPLYALATLPARARLLAEPRRPSTGPWPEWAPPIGPPTRDQPAERRSESSARRSGG